MKPRKIGSLSACIGTLELGLSWAGVGEVAWQVEEDAFCRSVLAKHWPEAEQFDGAGDERLGGLDGSRDVVCVGRDGSRDAAWEGHVRVLRSLRPRFVVVEHRADRSAVGLRRVLGGLASLGYDAEWRCLGATSVGATVRRERFYVVAWRPLAGDERRNHGGAPDVGPARREDAPESRVGRASPRPSGGVHRWPAAPEAAQGEEEPARFLLVDNDVNRAKRLAALDRATVPQVAERVGLWLLQIGRREGFVG